jgi:hypothetical protein
MRAEARVALCGALGGGVNAWLCYARLPVAVSDNPDFAWHLIPAGAVHGGVLAFAAFGAGMLLCTRRLRTRLAVAPPLAWVAGFVAWIPLNRSAFQQPWPESFSWALREGWGPALLGPLQYFGFVALLYYLAVALFLARERRLAVHVSVAAVAGVAGSLWWWITIGPWYFSALHGAIWGTLVGVGAWAASQIDGASVRRFP